MKHDLSELTPAGCGALQGRSLIDIVNTEHHHPKYLPGCPLGNVVASGDLDWVVEGADFLVFCAPHEFMHGITRRLMGKVCEQHTGPLAREQEAGMGRV